MYVQTTLNQKQVEDMTVKVHGLRRQVFIKFNANHLSAEIS
jgi:hypothetical protein